MPQAKSVREWLLQFDGQVKTPAAHRRAPPPLHPLNIPLHPLHPFPPPSQAEKLVIPAMRRAMASGDGGGKKHAVGSGAYKSLV